MASSDEGSFDQGSGDPGEGADDPKNELGGDDRAHRGWVPPEKRVWRHPSETGPWSVERPVGAGSALPRPVGRRTAWATSLVGAGAVAALVTGGLMLASHSTSGPTSVASPPASATRSIVRLDVGSSSSSSSYGCGVVVAAGGLIATNATLLANAQWIIATTSTGRREAATVVAVDPASDVGLVRVATTLPVARFVDWSDVQPGADAMEMAVSAPSPGITTTVWTSGTIASSGEAVESGPGTGMVSVVASVPSGSNSPAGAVLLEPDGTVLGILDKAGVAADGNGAVFLPGEFVKQVATELMSDGGHIVHGWLGIHGANPSAKQPAGALVVAVDRSGAADDNLRRGDVIEAIDGVRVRSMADLRSRLYLLAPGTWVDLRVDRGRTVRTVGLWLGSSG